MKHRFKTDGVQWRNVNPRQEMAKRSQFDDLIHEAQVAAEVDARTGGICIFEECTGKVISYPHAVPHRLGGVHGVMNRAGVCVIHSMAIYAAWPDDEYRGCLQRWLQLWYRQFGISQAMWMDIATGLMPHPANPPGPRRTEEDAAG